METDSEVAVHDVLKSRLRNQDKSKVRSWISNFVSCVESLAPLLADTLSLEAQRNLPRDCAKQLAAIFRCRCCVTTLKICSLSELLGEYSEEGVWSGKLQARSCRHGDSTDGQRQVLLVHMTAQPRRSDLFVHTPGSLFLQDSTNSILCEVISCRAAWIDNIVLVPAWQFVSFKKIPALGIAGSSNQFDLVGGGYFELLQACVPCIARTSLSVDQVAAITVTQLSSVPLTRKTRGLRYNVRGTVTSVSPVYRNGYRPCYFLVELCDITEGHIVTIAVMTKQHLHWVHRLSVQEEVAITELRQVTRKGDKLSRGEELMLSTSDASELATCVDFSSAIGSPSCSSTSPCLTDIPRSAQPVCPGTESPGPVTRSRARQLSEAGATDSDGSTSHGQMRQPPGDFSADAMSLTLQRRCLPDDTIATFSPKKVSTPVSTEAARPSRYPSMPVKRASSSTRTPSSAKADMSMGGWTLSTQQLLDLSLAMNEAESVFGQTAALSTRPQSSGDRSSAADAVGTSAACSGGDGAAMCSEECTSMSPLAKRRRLCSPVVSPLAGSMCDCDTSPTSCSLASRTSGELPTCVEDTGMQPTTLPQHAQQFCFVNYLGTITSCEDSSVGIFVLDDGIKLQCAHQSCCHWCRGWRVGARIHLNKVHMLHTPCEGGRVTTLACCSASTVRVVAFSRRKDLVMMQPFFSECHAIAYHAWELNCLQYTQFIRLVDTLVEKFCPTMLREDRVLGKVVGQVEQAASGADAAAGMGSKHEGVADWALKALWLSKGHITGQVTSNDCRSGTQPISSQQQQQQQQQQQSQSQPLPRLRQRDAMLEFNSEPHQCGVIGRPFPAVNVPLIREAVDRVRKFAFERNVWHRSTGEQLLAEQKGTHWRYTTVTAHDLSPALALVATLNVSLHSGRLQLHDQSGCIDVVVADITGGIRRSEPAPCHIHTKCYPSPSTSHGRLAQHNADQPCLLACNICYTHQLLPEHLGCVWCVRNVLFVVEQFCTTGAAAHRKETCEADEIVVYCVFSLGDMQWLYPARKRKGRARHPFPASSSMPAAAGAGAGAAAGAGAGAGAVADGQVPRSGVSASRSNTEHFLVAHVKPCRLLLEQQGVVGLHSSIAVSTQQSTRAVGNHADQSDLIHIGLHGGGMHWFPTLHAGVRYRVHSANSQQVLARRAIHSADICLCTEPSSLASRWSASSYDTAHSPTTSNSTAATGDLPLAEDVLSVRDMLAFMEKELLAQSSKAVEKVLSFHGVLVCRDVNASRNTAEYKRSAATPPPKPQRPPPTPQRPPPPATAATLSCSSVSDSRTRDGAETDSAASSSGQLVFLSGCGWVYSDVLTLHGLPPSLLEHFAILTVRDCHRLDSVKVFMPLDKNPYPLALLPGALLTIHNAVVKGARSGDVSVQVNKGMTHVSVQSLRPLAGVVAAPSQHKASLPLLPLSSALLASQQQRQYLHHLAAAWRSGVSSMLVHSVLCHVVHVQHVTVAMRCCTCTGFLQQHACPHDDGHHTGSEPFAEARFIVDDSTAEAVVYAYDDRVRLLLGLSTATWHGLLQASLESGAMSYQRSSFVPGQFQECGDGSLSPSDLERAVLAQTVYREVLLHCSMLRVRQQPRAQESQVRIGKHTLNVLQHSKPLLRAAHIDTTDCQLSVINLLAVLRQNP